MYMYIIYFFKYQPLEVTNWTPFAISGDFRTFWENPSKMKWNEVKKSQ